MQDIAFTIITVVKDDLSGLIDSRVSLDQQTFKNWKHIIIDGNSSDGTQKYLETLPNSNTQWISESDTGIYNAMNKAIQMLCPDVYVYFLNAKDTFATPQSLEFAALNLVKYKYPLWGCSTHEEIELDGSGWICKLVSKPCIENQLFAIGYRSHQAVVVKSNLLIELNGFDEDLTIAADWDLIVKCLLVCEPATWKESLGRFSLGGFSNINIVEAHKELRILRKKYLKRNFLTPLYEFIWTTLYTPFENRRQFSNKFDAISFLIQRFILKDRTRTSLNSKTGKNLRFIRISLSYLIANLFKPISYQDFEKKEIFLNKYAIYNRLKFEFFAYYENFLKVIDGNSLRISSIRKLFCLNNFISYIHSRMGIKPFE